MSESITSGGTAAELTGTDDAIIDDKGRVLVSKRNRDALGPKFTMYLGNTGCIYAVSAEGWQGLKGEVRKHDLNNPGTLEYTDLIYGDAATELDFDQQGRVVIPRKLRELAKLRDKVLLRGALYRLEIWAVEERQRYEQDVKGYGRDRRERIENAYKEMLGS